MKSVIFYLILLNIIKTESFKINDTLPISLQCKLITTIKDQSHTIFLDLKNNSADILKTCMIQSCGLNHSLLLLNGENVPHIKKNVLSAFHPNVVMFTETLGPEILGYTSLYNILESHWSVLYIIVISRNGSFYGCEDGVFNRDGYIQTETFLNDLWHIHQIMRVVVAFPFTCPNQFAVYSGKKYKHKSLYDRKIKLVHAINLKELVKIILQSDENVTYRYPLRGNLFYRFPTCVTECHHLFHFLPLNRNLTGEFCGFDTLIMQDLINHFKFDVYFPNLDYCNKYGYAIPEQNITHGALGCIVRNEIDISFNARFMEPYPNDNFYYLHYVKQDSLCVLLEQPSVFPIWHYPYTAFSVMFWIIIVIIIIILGAMMWKMAKIMQKYNGQEVFKLHCYLINSVTSTLFGFFINKKITISFLQGTCLCLSIVLSAMYQGHVNYLFTTLIRFKRIDTLDKLYMSDVILYTSPSIKQLLKPLENTSDEKLTKYLRKVLIRSSEESDDKRDSHLSFLLQNHKAATVARKWDVLLEIQLFYMDKDGRPLLYVIDECFRNYYISLIASKNFPFIEDLRQFMQRLMESGLPEAYYRWTGFNFGLSDCAPKYGPETRPYTKVTLKDNRIGFIILLLGYLISTITLIIEKWLWKRYNVC